MEGDDKKKKELLNLILKELKGLFIFLFVVLVIYFVFRFSPLYDVYDVEKLKGFLGGMGNWAIPVYLLCYAILPLFIFPISPLSMVSGVIFGTFLGFVLSAIGYMINCWLAFFLTRGMFREKITGIVSGRGIKMDRGIVENGVLATFLLRFVPLTPVGFQSYAAGLSGIKWTHYTLGTILGGLVWVFVFVLMGDSLLRPGSREFFTSLLLWTSLFLVSIFVLVKKRAVFLD
jgi:uncharacterized membrane protein YdjX (TVP38/TMEM64 family)